MKRRNTLALTLCLSFLSTLGPFSLDMYLPSLPDIARSLQASTLEVQLTISSYLFGSAVGQIFYGAVSDRVGRRPVLLWALVFYSIITTACAVASSVDVLITLRFVQGVGVAGIMVLARAMVRDISSGVRAGLELSLMGSITGLAPIIAPVIGGGLLQSALYGLSPFVFGVTFATGSAGYVLGTLIAARAMVRFGLDFVIGVGTAAMAVGGLSMAAVIALALPHVLWLVGAMTLYLTGLGVALAATRAAALTPFGDRAATAASIMGLMQQTGAAVSATVVGFYLGHSAWPVGSVVAVMGCLSFVI